MLADLGPHPHDLVDCCPCYASDHHRARARRFRSHTRGRITKQRTHDRQLGDGAGRGLSFEFALQLEYKTRASWRHHGERSRQPSQRRPTRTYAHVDDGQSAASSTLTEDGYYCSFGTCLLFSFAKNLSSALYVTLHSLQRYVHDSLAASDEGLHADLRQVTRLIMFLSLTVGQTFWSDAVATDRAPDM